MREEEEEENRERKRNQEMVDEEAEEGLSEGQVTQIQLARALCGAGLQSGATVGRAVQQLTNRNKPAESLKHMLC